MREILEQYKKGIDLHHAYIVVGDPAKAIRGIEDIVCAVFDSTRESLISNPDFLFSRANVFGVDESRILKERQLGRPFSGKKRIFVCQVNFMTREAQNALLKTMEEPAKDNHFFFIAPTKDIFLPTLISRVSVLEIPVDRVVSHDEESTFSEFFSSDVKKRVEILTQFSDENPEEARARTINFLDQLERFVAISLLGKLKPSEHVILKMIWRAKKNLMITGSVPKLVIENLAIGLPKIG